MTNETRSTRRKWLRGSLVAFALLVGLSWIPLGKAPSAAEWVAAYYRGDGKPHFPIPGTPETRKAAFYQRHPGLVPAWREVPLERNGTLQLRAFVTSETANDLKLTGDLEAMLRDDTKWDQKIAREYCENQRDNIAELRRIARLPEHSSKGRPADEILDSRKHKAMSDVLLFSMKRHLRDSDIDGAFADFSALHGFAAHVDCHEAPTLMDETVAILIRLSAQKNLLKSLGHIPADTDWSAWIRMLESQAPFTEQHALMWTGEAWTGAHLIWDLTMAKGEKNPIWDFTEFEDAYAAMFLARSKACADVKHLREIDSHKLKIQVDRQASRLSEGARGLMSVLFIGTESWGKGVIRSEAEQARLLAALQLLQAERAGGPIRAANDPRLGGLAIDPSVGQPFNFDPATRKISAPTGSYLADEEPLQLPPR